MIGVQPPSIRFSAKPRWLSFSVSAGILGVLLAFFLYKVIELQEYSEKTVVEVTIRNIRSGLQLAQGEAIMHGREHEIEGWAGKNPIRWLGTDPANYQGNCGAAGSTLKGIWCFDQNAGELVYLPRYAAESRWRIETHRAPNGKVVAASVRNVTRGDGRPE